MFRVDLGTKYQGFKPRIATDKKEWAHIEDINGQQAIIVQHSEPSGKIWYNIKETDLPNWVFISDKHAALGGAKEIVCLETEEDNIVIVFLLPAFCQLLNRESGEIETFVKGRHVVDPSPIDNVIIHTA